MEYKTNRYIRVFHNFTTFDFSNGYQFFWWDFGTDYEFGIIFVLWRHFHDPPCDYYVIFRCFLVSRESFAIEAWGLFQMTQNGWFPICLWYII